MTADSQAASKGLMYNRPSPSLVMNEWQVVLRLARCAQKYDVSRAKEVAAAYFTEQEQLGALSPFMTYAFAVQYSECQRLRRQPAVCQYR
jgi:hypothetical protein